MAFGQQGFVQLYNDFGATENFHMVPAIRKVEGPCVDEGSCDYEKYTLCAFNMTQTKTQIAFLACMDDQDRTVAAKDAATTCAAKTSLSFDAISACFASPGLDRLVQAASDDFNARLPGQTSIPHTFVNEKDVQPNYDSLKQALCDAGSQAAVCNQKAAEACVV